MSRIFKANPKTERWEKQLMPCGYSTWQWSIAGVEYWGYYSWKMRKHNSFLLYNLSKKVFAMHNYFKKHISGHDCKSLCLYLKLKIPRMCVNILEHNSQQLWNIILYLCHTFCFFLVFCHFRFHLSTNNWWNLAILLIIFLEHVHCLCIKNKKIQLWVLYIHHL